MINIFQDKEKHDVGINESPVKEDAMKQVFIFRIHWQKGLPQVLFYLFTTPLFLFLFLIPLRSDDSVQLWPKLYNQETVWEVIITPDGRYLVSESGVGTIKVWDLRRGHLLRTLEGNRDSGLSLSVTPDGRYVVGGSDGDDGMIKIWDLESGRLLRTLKGHEGPVRSVSVTPDGRYVVSGGDYDNTIKVWDFGSGRLLRALKGHEGLIFSVCVTPDGRHLVSGSEDGTIKVWDLRSGRLIRTLKGHKVPVNYFCVTPGGRYLVSESLDDTIKVWDLESGRLLWTLEGHEGPVWSVSVTPDGRYLVSGGWDGVRIWDLSEGKEVVVAVVYKDGAWVWINRNGYFNASDDGLKYVNVRRGEEVTTGEENLDLRNPEKAGLNVGKRWKDE